MTVRSLITRISGFVAYRHATRAMNTLPDATAEDLAQDKTCIVCREDMEVWNAAGPAPQDSQQAPNQAFSDERQRPKKLPCGHILHKGCLKAWLERQQTCPTCRRTVLPSQQPQNENQNAGNAQPGNQPGHPPRPDANPGQPGQGPQLQGWRLNLGPLRLFVGRGPADILREQLRQQGLNGNNDEQRGAQQADTPNAQAGTTQPSGTQPRGTSQVQGAEAQRRAVLYRQARIETLQQELNRELANLALQQQQLAIVRSLQSEFYRLSALQSRNQQQGLGQPAANYIPGFPTSAVVAVPAVAAVQDTPQAFVGDEAVGTGSPRLPDGMVLPEGWTVLPLTRLGEADRALSALAQSGVGSLASDLPAAVAPNGAAVIASALGLPPLPTNGVHPAIASIRVDSPIPGPSIQPGQPAIPAQAPVNAPQPRLSSSIPQTALGSQRQPSSVPIGDLLSRLAQAQEEAAGPSGPAVASPVPVPTQARSPLSQTPSWGFGEVAARPPSTGTESTGTESSSEHNETIHPASDQKDASKEKGKGKAKSATVEDATDDVDMD